MVSVIIVGINQWEEYTLPLIKQVRQHEPDCEIIVVDNASDVPYEDIDVPALVVRTDERLCYSAAINIGVNMAHGDWLLPMNNDASCTGPFMDHIETHIPAAIYAPQIVEEAGHRWFGNWIVAIPRCVWDEVGEFDVNYLVCGFEDADYSERANGLDIPTIPIDLPFIHHGGKTRWDIPGYPATREQNIKYFALKHGWTPGSNMVVTHD
jgi:GT2 family glycosyltransferase